MMMIVIFHKQMQRNLIVELFEGVGGTDHQSKKTLEAGPQPHHQQVQTHHQSHHQQVFFLISSSIGQPQPQIPDLQSC